MKQTAVEFYVQKFDELLIKLDFNEISDEEYLEEKKHLTIIAKEMEKQQIGEAYEDGYSDSDNTFELNKEYYNEKFINK